MFFIWVNYQWPAYAGVFTPFPWSPTKAQRPTLGPPKLPWITTPKPYALFRWMSIWGFKNFWGIPAGHTHTHTERVNMCLCITCVLDGLPTSPFSNYSDATERCGVTKRGGRWFICRKWVTLIVNSHFISQSMKWLNNCQFVRVWHTGWGLNWCRKILKPTNQNILHKFPPWEKLVRDNLRKPIKF